LFATALTIGYLAPVIYVEYKIHEENQKLAQENNDDLIAKLKDVNQIIKNTDEDAQQIIDELDYIDSHIGAGKTEKIIYTATPEPTIKPGGN